MNRRRIGTSLYSGLLFAVLGVIALVSGQPFVFPSLGPSAFILSFERQWGRTRARHVVGSHLIGGAGWFLAHSLLASGVSPSPRRPSRSRRPGSLWR